MHHDFIDDLLATLERVIQPDQPQLRELLIFNGMPEDTQNLRYLSYNRQRVNAQGRTLLFTVAAVVNNRRISHWRLTGYHEKISRMVFNPRWTRSPLDLFLIRLRSHRALMDILASASARYSLIGIMHIEMQRAGLAARRRTYRIHPVVGLPGIDEEALGTIVAFEKANEIERRRI
jgi:hypothetical protein